MLEHFRIGWRKVMTRPARLLIKLGVTSNAVTWVGSILCVVIALVGFPLGWLATTALLLGAVVMCDSLDGQISRLSGSVSTWGSFLDSTLDRVADGAIFAGIALFYAADGRSYWWCFMAIMALITAEVTSYTKARGEAVGCEVHGGIVTRSDRLLIVLVAALITGLGWAPALPIALTWLTIGGLVSIGQRMVIVYRQAEMIDRSDREASVPKAASASGDLSGEGDCASGEASDAHSGQCWSLTQQGNHQ